MKSKIEQNPRFFEIAEKMLKLVKGENYDDVENAIKSVLEQLKRRSIVN